MEVRDVAKAHVAAGFIKEAKGRHITYGHNSTPLKMADALRGKYGEDYLLPKMFISKFLIWLIGPLLNSAMTRKVIAKNAGYEWKADNSNSTKEMGVVYRLVEETMNDFFQ